MEQFKTGFIGCGNMASAIIGGMRRAGIKDIFVYDKDANQCASMPDVTICADVDEVSKTADIIFLCVKPKIIPDVLGEVTAEGKAFVSIAAGVTSAKLRACLKPPARIMRIMPNTPLLVGKGAICIETPTDFTQQEQVFIEAVFGALGLIEHVNGDLMDSVTGVSGSGPAYVYMLIDALAKAGEQHGLEADMSLRLALQTFEGACEMLRKTGKSPSTLIENVCSPGGTTLEAMRVFEENGTREIMQKAVDACIARSKELSK